MFSNIENIKTFYIAFHTVAGLLGCFFNLILIYLAIFRSPKAIATYTIILFNVGVTNFLACFTDFFLQQRHIPAGLTLAYTSHGFCTYFGPEFCFHVYSMNIHFIAHGLYLLLLAFAYRYYVLFHPVPSRRTMIIVVLIVYIPSFAQWIIFMFADDDPEEVRKILAERFPNYDLRNETVSGTINIINFPALYTILHMTCPITPVYIIIVILRKKIIDKLMKHSEDMTPKTKQLHSQLLTALTYQAMIPSFYSLSIASYTICQFFYSHPIFEYTTFTGFLFIPVLAPLSSIFFINVYKIIVMSWIYRIIGKPIPEEWAHIVSRNSKAGPTSVVNVTSVKDNNKNT